MKNRTLPLLVALVVLVGIAASIFYLNKKGSSEPGAMTTQPAATPSSLAATPTAQPSMAAASPAPGQTQAAVDLTVDANGLSKTTAVIQTDKGLIRFKFYPKDAPNTTNRIIQLIQQGFYNGIVFHRVVPGFVIQGGDPTGTGANGSGQTQKAEFNGRRHLEGTVAMARKGNDPDSADSQFYITLAPQPQLDHSYTVFGQVIEGMDVVRKIQVGDKMTKVSLE